MSESMESSFNAAREGVPEEVMVFVIAFNTITGQCQVQGPIGNKGMCYQMLELAKDCVRKYTDENIPGVIKP